MSRYRVAAAAAAFLLGAAVVTALAGAKPDVGGNPVPQVRADVDAEANAAPDLQEESALEATSDLGPTAAKSDRLAVRGAKPDARQGKPALAVKPASSPGVYACPQEPWPYGCQWRERTRKVMRGSRPT
jgi:hypothetical protein